MHATAVSSIQATAMPPTVLHVTAHYDSLLVTHGLAPHSPAFSRLWTPNLGPAAAALYRSLTDLVGEDASTPDAVVDVLCLAASIGVGARKAGRTVHDGLHRLALYDLAHTEGETVAVRMHAPTPTRSRLARVPSAWRGLCP